MASDHNDNANDLREKKCPTIRFHNSGTDERIRRFPDDIRLAVDATAASIGGQIVVDQKTTVVKSGSNMGLIVLVILLAVVAVGGFLFYQSEQNKNDSISGAATAVGDAAKDVGDAAKGK
jgi:hypothetical protein